MTRVGDASLATGSSNSQDPHDQRRTARSADRSENRSDPDRTPATRLWDIEEVSAYLHVPVSAIYKMTARHAAVSSPHLRLGGRLRFRQRDLDQWLALLSTSNLEALTKMRRIARKVTHGDDSSSPSGER